MEADITQKWLDTPIALEGAPYIDLAAIDPGTVNFALSAARCFGLPPNPRDFVKQVVNELCDNNLSLAHSIGRQGWATENGFFEPLFAMHANFIKNEYNVWSHPSVEQLARNTQEDMIDQVSALALQLIYSAASQTIGDRPAAPPSTLDLAAPPNTPVTYWDDHIKGIRQMFPRVALVHALARVKETETRKIIRNYAHTFLRPETSWLFSSQIPVIFENQQDQVKKSKRKSKRPPIMWFIQLMGEAVIDVIDSLLGRSTRRVFLYVGHKWGIRPAVCNWYPEDYPSEESVPEDDDDEEDNTKYNHRKQAMKRLMAFVIALHPFGGDLYNHLNKQSKSEDELDAFGMILRAVDVYFRPTKLTAQEVENNSELIQEARTMNNKGNWIVTPQARAPDAPAKGLKGTEDDFRRLSGTPKRKKVHTDAIVSESGVYKRRGKKTEGGAVVSSTKKRKPNNYPKFDDDEYFDDSSFASQVNDFRKPSSSHRMHIAKTEDGGAVAQPFEEPLPVIIGVPSTKGRTGTKKARISMAIDDILDQ